MKEQSRNRRRAAKGQGRTVFTRAPFRSNRLNASVFATAERAQDFVRRATINGMRVVCVF
jgi:hypothetical protein